MDKRDKFGDAEHFMLQVAEVKRYQARLQCQKYMGTFEETVRTIEPVSAQELFTHSDKKTACAKKNLNFFIVPSYVANQSSSFSIIVCS